MRYKNAEIEILGIRHHGPGSARALLRFLEDWQPDTLLVEGPTDGDDLIRFVAEPGMEPPVALLVYNPKQLSQASFFPFARYSPEWQAFQYAVKNGIPARFMDLPISMQLSARASKAEAFLNKGDDPFSEIAALGGYSDPERWWEAMIERGASQQKDDPFTLIRSLMTALREAKQNAESEETLLREAFMRTKIREAEKLGAQKIAVICGAWHAPALEKTENISVSEDKTLLKGIKKIKTACGWIPWSFPRLSKQSGYGAGVVAPAWYDIIWERGLENAASFWLTQSAQALRKEGLDTASAHIIEALRLAETLATLRQTQAPGIEELLEAARTVMGQGDEQLESLLTSQMVIGQNMGQVPDSVPQAPLKKDFDAQVKSCRLKLSPEEKALSVDLRQEAGLRKSHLLHRMSLLNIPWGKNLDAEEGRHGSFAEDWILVWEPEFEIQLIEAGVWGNTVEQAARNKTADTIQNTGSLTELASLLDSLLKAYLPDLLTSGINKLKNLASLDADAISLATAVFPLVTIWRYGSARKMPIEGVRTLLDGIIPRVCIQLPTACKGLNEAAAEEVLKQLIRFNRALGILDSPDHAERFELTLHTIAEQDDSAPQLRGLAVRLLFDKQAYTLKETEQALFYHLSGAQEPYTQALWLEGFLNGSGLLLVHNPALWTILDRWLGSLTEERFQETLPVLRRAFSNYAGPEREKILSIAKGAYSNGPTGSGSETDLNPERSAAFDDLFGKLFPQ